MLELYLPLCIVIFVYYPCCDMNLCLKFSMLFKPFLPFFPQMGSSADETGFIGANIVRSSWRYFVVFGVGVF